MRADNIIAHAYEAPSSPVENLTHDGFDAAEGRTYANDFTDPNSPKDLKASGFNTVGDGEKLVFDIQGVSPDNVISAGYSQDANYRWAVIVDNNYHRNIANIYNIPVTAQLYTALTGSFALSMGNVIAQETKAPVVHYNPYEVVNLPRTENSFYRLTYKDDKIQKTTVTPDFSDIDKSTYKPTKRQYIRFSIVDPDDGFIKVSEKKRKNNARIIAINDISRGGVLVTHDGTLKVGEEFVLSLNCNGIEASPTVEVVRIYDSNKAGLKFGDLDSATANKILYMNMYSAEKQDLHTSQK